jgi:hypothetical protein
MPTRVKACPRSAVKNRGLYLSLLRTDCICACGPDHLLIVSNNVYGRRKKSEPEEVIALDVASTSTLLFFVRVNALPGQFLS